MQIKPYEYYLYGTAQLNLNKFIYISSIFDMKCMIMYKRSTYSTFSFPFLHLISTHSTGWSSLFESTGSTHWCVGTKRMYLRHHFNNVQPARWVLSALAEPCYQLDRLSRHTSSFHTIAHQTSPLYYLS